MIDQPSPPAEGEQQRIARVEQEADLLTIGNGVSNEKFRAELEKVLQNIRDPNTEPEDRRTITLKFVFHPSKDRDTVVIAISAASSLPASKPSGDIMYVGRKDGEVVGMVMQPKFDAKVDPRQGILPLRKVQGTDGE